MASTPVPLPLLTAAEEVELARRIEAGVAAAAVLAGEHLAVAASRGELERLEAEGQQAQDRFMLSNLRLVYFVTGGTGRDTRVSQDEVFQEAVVALAEAVRSFDYRQGKFSTWALPKLRWKVLEQVTSRGGSLGVPSYRAIQIRRARAITARLENESRSPVATSEVAAELGLSDTVAASLLQHRAPVSIDAMTPTEFERIAGAGEVSTDPVIDLRAEVGRLPEQERETITVRYGLADGRPRSWREVAAETGMSESTAMRTCERGLESLRDGAAKADTDDSPSRLEQARVLARKLSEVDRLSRAGLCLVEVAIAMKTEPGQVHDLCQAGHRQDLLVRFGRIEQTYGFEPGPYTARYVTVTEESQRRRERFKATAAALGEPSTTLDEPTSYRTMPEPSR